MVDPAVLVALLRDPDEPGRTYAYEAVEPFAPNATYVFAPDGEVIVGDGSGGTLRSPSQTGGVIRGSTSKAYLVPIDVCYELVGLVRLHWKGFDGGEEAWGAINAFFADLRGRSKRVAREDARG